MNAKQRFTNRFFSLSIIACTARISEVVIIMEDSLYRLRVSSLGHNCSHLQDVVCCAAEYWLLQFGMLLGFSPCQYT